MSLQTLHLHNASTRYVVLVSGEAVIRDTEKECSTGLAPRRQLPDGWDSAAGSRRRLKAAEIQCKQKASVQQLETVLEE